MEDRIYRQPCETCCQEHDQAHSVFLCHSSCYTDNHSCLVCNRICCMRGFAYTTQKPKAIVGMVSIWNNS